MPRSIRSLEHPLAEGASPAHERPPNPQIQQRAGQPRERLIAAELVAPAAAATQPANQEGSPSTPPQGREVHVHGRQPANGRCHGKEFSLPFDSWPLELDAVLMDYCRRGRAGEHDVMAMLDRERPEVDLDLVWARIVYLGLTRSRRPPYRKHRWSADDDDILRQGYSKGRSGSSQATDELLECHPGLSRDSVTRRARKLGLTHGRTAQPRTWTPEADEELLSLAEYQLESITKRLKRSPKSILGRLAKLGRDATFFGGYKTKDLMEDLNMSQSAVRRLVRRGILERVHGRITEESLIGLCRKHPKEIPFNTLKPENQNWAVNGLNHGKKIRPQKGGRRKIKDPAIADEEDF